MKKYLLQLAWIAVATLTTSCSSLMFWEDEPSGESMSSEDSLPENGDSKSVPKNKKSTQQLLDERELKMARLWSRVDELEEEQSKQKEKLKLLEKGLTLGMIPDELKSFDKPNQTKQSNHNQKDPSQPKSEVSLSKHPSATPLLPLSAQEEKSYQDALASAHDHFRAGRYGRALVEYDAMGKRWGDRVPGAMYKYWTAKCWMQLKEYSTARQILTDFVTNHGNSPWIPRAKLELGRSEVKLGQNETAIRRFRELIRDHPYEDARELAEMELVNIGKNL